MNLNEIMILQKEFDSAHGWSLEGNNQEQLLVMLNKDLIGLFGEIGEFANIIKKLNLIRTSDSDDYNLKFTEEIKAHLTEEIIDSLIYLLRIATHLNIDIGSEYLKKLDFNKKRYRNYEIIK